MKKITAMLLAGAMMLSLAACGGGNNNAPANSGNNPGGSTPAGSTPASSTPAGDADKYAGLDKVTLIGADNSSMGAAAQLFGELVTEKVNTITGGQLTIEYFPNSELGADADLLRQLQSNDIQLVVCQTAPVVSFVPEVAVFDLPMVFAQYDAATIDKVLNGDGAFNKQLGESFNNAGLQLMGILQGATYRLTTSNTALNTIDDFNGLLIRTMENQNHMTFWKALKAQPTPMAWNEVFFALQSGNIAAQENAADTCVGANLQEVQKYLACTNHILYANMMIMNKDAWAGLDPAYQDALKQAVSEARAYRGPPVAPIDADNKKTLCEDSGKYNMTLIEYDDSFYADVLALPAVQDLYKDIDSQVGGLGSVLQTELAG